MNNDLPKRKSTRIKDYDYSTEGVYFVTICIRDRMQVLSEIVKTEQDILNNAHGIRVGEGLAPPEHRTILKPCGIIVKEQLLLLESRYDNVTIEDYVIMPDHIHLIICICMDGQSRTPVPTTKANSEYSKFISTFKRFCNKEYGYNVWQSRSYDHIIRDKHDYDEISKYIYENPLKWQFDELYCEEQG